MPAPATTARPSPSITTAEVERQRRELARERADFERRKANVETGEAALRIAKRSAEASALVQDLVKSGQVPPHLASTCHRLLVRADDTQVVEFATEEEIVRESHYEALKRLLVDLQHQVLIGEEHGQRVYLTVDMKSVSSITKAAEEVMAFWKRVYGIDMGFADATAAIMPDGTVWKAAKARG
jgi:hypothetical protein